MPSAPPTQTQTLLDTHIHDRDHDHDHDPDPNHDDDDDDDDDQPGIIAILGAGILGLTSAITIQRTRTLTLPSSDTDTDPIILIAEHLPTRTPSKQSINYTSAWAGAHYRPVPVPVPVPVPLPSHLPPGVFSSHPSDPNPVHDHHHHHDVQRAERHRRQLHLEARLAQRTYELRKREVRDYGEERSGIKFMEGVEYLEDVEGKGKGKGPGQEAAAAAASYLRLKTGDVYAGKDDGFRVFTEEELRRVPASSGGTGTENEKENVKVKWGCRYWTYDINPDVYCPFLLEEFEKGGGLVIQRKVGSVEEVFDLELPPPLPSRPEAAKNGWKEDGKKKKKINVKTVVNCSGRGFGDDKVFIARGQTVLVRNHCSRTVTRQNADGSWTALIPRPGAGTIVGVTKEIGDMEEWPRLETREVLLEKARELLFLDHDDDGDDDHDHGGVERKDGSKGWEVIRDIVGRRPMREGGLRLEVELVKEDKAKEAGGGERGVDGKQGEGKKKKRIIHAYGVGSRGFELSWGIAEEVMKMVLERERSKL